MAGFRWMAALCAVATAACGPASPAPRSGDAALSSVLASSTPSAAHAEAPATVLRTGRVLVAGGERAGGTATREAELFDPLTGAWTPTDPLWFRRGRHTAALLGDGSVLAVGGWDPAPVATCERYIPASGTWLKAAPLGRPRSHHAMVVLGDGRVLVAGGLVAGGTPTSSAEVFDPAAHAWTPTGELNVPRRELTLTRLPDGRVLAAGGHVAETEVYDPAAGTWTLTTPLPAALHGHTATLRQDGAVLVVGGTTDGSASPAAALWSTDPSGIWTSSPLPAGVARHATVMAPSGKLLVAGGTDAADRTRAFLLAPEGAAEAVALAAPRERPAAALLQSGQILLAGGAAPGTGPSAELVDPGAFAVAPSGSPRAERLEATATLLPDGALLVLGGRTAAAAAVTWNELLDPGGTAWSYPASLREPRWAHTATLLPSGQVLVVGGQGPQGAPGAELYDPVTRTFAPVAGGPARWRHTATLLASGQLLVLGGCAPGEATPCGSTAASVYDPATGSWTPARELPTARAGHTATRLRSGKVLVTGGLDGAAAWSHDLFDPATGTWAPTSALPLGFTDHTATLLPSGDVLLVGGRGGTGARRALLYSAQTLAFEEVGSLARARQRHAAALDAAGDVVVAGGTEGCGRDEPIERYSPATRRFSIVGASSACRVWPILAPAGGGALVVTGGALGDSAAEALDDGRGGDAASGPRIVRLPDAVRPGATFTARGANLTLERDPLAAAAPPAAAQLRGAETALWVKATVAATAVYFTLPAGLPDGWYRLTLSNAGALTAPVSLHVVAPPPAAAAAPSAGAPRSALGFSCGHGGGAASLLGAAALALLARRRRRPALAVAALLVAGEAAGAAPGARGTPGASASARAPPIAARRPDAPASAGDPASHRRVAVIRLRTGAGVDHDVADAFTDALVAALDERGIPLITTSDVESALGFERQRQLLGCADDPSCLAEIAGAFGANWVVAGNLAKLEHLTVVRLLVFDSRAGVVGRRFYAQLPEAGIEALLAEARRAAGVLFPGTGAQSASAFAPGSAPAPAPAPASASASASAPASAPAPASSTSTSTSTATATAPAPAIPTSTDAPPFRVSSVALYDPVDPGGVAALLVEWRPAQFRLGAGPALTGAREPAVLARLDWAPLQTDRLRLLAGVDALAAFGREGFRFAGAGLGAEWALSRRLAVSLEISVVRLLSGPEGVKRTYALPGLSVSWAPWPAP